MCAQFCLADPPSAKLKPQLQISEFPAPAVPNSGDSWKSYQAKTESGLWFCFRLHLPAGQVKRLVVYLDGSLSGGADNLLQMSHPKLNRLLAAAPDTAVLIPQAPADLVWDSLEWQSGQKLPRAGPKPRELLAAVLSLCDLLGKRYSIADSQRTIIGYSLGAFGALDSLLHFPGKFGTVVSLAGLSDPVAIAKRAAGVRVRLFHGELDSVVDPGYSRHIDAAMQAGHGDCRIYLLPGKGHDIVDTVVAMPEFHQLLEAKSP